MYLDNGILDDTALPNFQNPLLTYTLCLFFFVVEGISGKSQLLFALVFTTRYLDLFTAFISLYNTSMKVWYFGAVAGGC